MSAKFILTKCSLSAKSFLAKCSLSAKFILRIVRKIAFLKELRKVCLESCLSRKNVCSNIHY